MESRSESNNITHADGSTAVETPSVGLPETAAGSATRTPGRKQHVGSFIAGMVVAFALVAAGAGIYAAVNREGGTETIVGTFTLIGGDSVSTLGGDCRGRGGYSDINSGTEVRLVADGELVAVTRLGHGQGASGRCTYSFSLDAPKGHKFYEVSVGRRGSFTYTWEELTTEGAIAYVLGGDN